MRGGDVFIAPGKLWDGGEDVAPRSGRRSLKETLGEPGCVG